jgi:hypothetical protein
MSGDAPPLTRTPSRALAKISHSCAAGPHARQPAPDRNARRGLALAAGPCTHRLPMGIQSVPDGAPLQVNHGHAEIFRAETLTETSPPLMPRKAPDSGLTKSDVLASETSSSRPPPKMAMPWR